MAGDEVIRDINSDEETDSGHEDVPNARGRESLRQLSQALAAAEARFSGAAAPAATDSHAARGVEPNLVTTEESRTEEDDRDVLQFLKDLRLGGDQAQHEPAAPNELTRLFMDLLVHRDNVHAERERLRSILPAVESDVLAAMIHDFLEGLDRAAENILVPSFHSRSQSHPRNGEQRQLRGQSDRKRGSYACWICGEDKKGCHYCLLPMTEEGIFVGKNGKKWKVRRLLDDERVRAASVSKGCDRLHPLLTEAALMQSSSKRPRTLTEGSESGGESEKRRHVCNLCGFPLQPKEEHAKKCIFLPGSHTCTMSDAITRMLAEPYDLKIHGTWDTCTMSDGTTRMLAELCDPKIHGTWEEDDAKEEEDKKPAAVDKDDAKEEEDKKPAAVDENESSKDNDHDHQDDGDNCDEDDAGSSCESVARMFPV